LKSELPKSSILLYVLLWERRLNAKDIHKQMFPVHGGKCLSCKAVQNWVKKFSQGRSKVADDARPGRPVEIATEATVQQVEELIRADRRRTIDSVATALGCSHGLAYSIMLRDAGRRQCRGQLAREVLLHHDNSRHHTAPANQERIQELQWELLEHLPYNPGLAPSDFHLFGPPKKHLGGKRFADDKEVEMEVR
jgi:hypothetical protein